MISFMCCWRGGVSRAALPGVKLLGVCSGGRSHTVAGYSGEVMACGAPRHPSTRPPVRRAAPLSAVICRASPPPPRAAARAASAASGRRDPHRPALAVVLLATFGLRLWGIKQGLPYIYNVDEATHFVPRAITFFGHASIRTTFSTRPPTATSCTSSSSSGSGSADAVARATRAIRPTIYVVARVVASVLGTIAVWLTYLTGKRLFGRGVGLMAAAIFGLAFLPIFYSHLALNDVPTLAPVALSLYGVAGVLREGAAAIT